MDMVGKVNVDQFVVHYNGYTYGFRPDREPLQCNWIERKILVWAVCGQPRDLWGLRRAALAWLYYKLDGNRFSLRKETRWEST